MSSQAIESLPSGPLASTVVGGSLAGVQLGSAALSKQAPLAHALATIEGQFELMKMPLGELKDEVNVVQRVVKVVDKRLEAVEKAVPFLDVPIGYARGKLANVSAWRAFKLVASNWDHLQPEWMKEGRKWLRRAAALWEQKNSVKLKVLHVNVDWKNSAVQRS